jgi:hypothetical protein
MELCDYGEFLSDFQNKKSILRQLADHFTDRMFRPGSPADSESDCNSQHDPVAISHVNDHSDPHTDRDPHTPGAPQDFPDISLERS